MLLIFNIIISRVHQKIQLYSKLAKTEMMSPLDTAYWWIQYVLKAGGNLDHLKVNLDQMPWYQYHMLDIAAIAVGVALLILFVLYVILRVVVSLFFTSNKKIKKH